MSVGIVPEEGQNRVGRQGHARRRDAQKENSVVVVDDRMHTECTLPGKHHCCVEEGAQGGVSEEASGVSQVEEKTKEEAGSSREEEKQPVKADLSRKEEKLSSKLKLSQREVEEVLAVLR